MTETPNKLNYIPFEGFEIGQKQNFGAYKVTEEEVIEFATKYDPQFFHLDHEAAKDSLFGGLCASGWHTCAMTMSMMVANMDAKGRSLGSPGIDSLRWLRPVYPEDVLSVEMEVLDTTPSKSRPDIGVVLSKVSVSNQNGIVVMEFVSKGIFSRNETGLGAEDKDET
jgi:acyl dehydratase